MAEIINEKIAEFVRQYRDADTSLDSYCDEPVPEPVQESRAITLTLNLDKVVDKQELMEFVHSLDLGHAARLQGACNYLYSVSRLVVQQRKTGIPPKPIPQK